jgi:predicted RNase H-related nuclease YkuK (DUF458 family)
MKWKRVNNGPIDKPLLEYLEGLFEEEIEKGYEFKVCIGTDSQKAGKGYKFATAIVIETREHMGIEYKKKWDGTKEKIDSYVGRGVMVMGTTFWEEMKASTNKKKHREKEVINQRMLREVSASIAVGYEIWPLLDLYGVAMEIHADINPDPRWDSNVAMSEALGYINGMGWDAKVKPDAYAASKGADKLCK